VRLPPRNANQLDELGEFDIWITPSLGEITETQRFKDELAVIAEIFDLLGAATENFHAIESCEANAIAATFAEFVSGRPVEERSRLLLALASSLFLVKCYRGDICGIR
jgi:hypothetical protein